MIKEPPFWWIHPHISKMCLWETDGRAVVRLEPLLLKGERDHSDVFGVVAREFLWVCGCVGVWVCGCV
jgi:hypothetical protein